MKIFLFTTLILLTACGKHSASPAEEQPIEAEAIKTTWWTISSTAVNFPRKYEIRTGSNILLNTCQDPKAADLSLEADRAMLNFEAKLIPRGPLSLEIIDLGETCDNNALFYSEEGALYGVIELTSQGEKSYSVSVSLNN